jgi:hypothetical protein
VATQHSSVPHLYASIQEIIGSNPGWLTNDPELLMDFISVSGLPSYTSRPSPSRSLLVPYSQSASVSFNVTSVVNVAIFWDIAPCSPYVNSHFGRMYRLHLQGTKSAEKEISVQQVASWFLARQNQYTKRKEIYKILIQTPWPESANELHQPSDHRLSAKLVPIFADRGCHVVSVTDPYGRILGFLDRSRYFVFQVAPRLYSRG